MRATVERSIEAIAPRDWNALAGTEQPFLRHEFLSALERTGCIGAGTGWTPAFFTLSDRHGLAAAAPAYIKTDSWGEFVFDFAWAQAHARYGLPYYPKLVLAVPFTPASGSRLLVRPGLDHAALAGQLIQQITAYAVAEGFSSIHALFVEERDRAVLARAGWLLRRDCQFHWSNAGYRSFDEYLQTFTAEKRKKARRERRRVAEAGIAFETRFGSDLDPASLDRIYAFHRDTFHRHGHEPYLNRAFFAEIARTLGESLMVKLAMHGSSAVAAAIFFWSPEALYGRYWGASADRHSLHFEACYHQGIEFCIERGVGRFEPGTQGEHKVSRGFEPAITWSAHYIAESRFRAAIGDFVGREAEAIEAYAREIRGHVPFRGRRDVERGRGSS
ncbi:MAG: GNAT family N-acetyltransferase [Steroidobacteraceae bacterium]